ncbi:SEC23-interacting protein isoform X1 [Polypterus senegalus]|uniref:SEC23-interacting protein isoform X1 n=2 Tax=Polypterus senegalus TaxID=55291 RepID=UPI00196492D6|nr:SEC23-interacting protein isoform X1 [Polypterus senegalus]
MAEKKPPLQSSSTNLLFSSTSDFSFNVPFIPVSQAAGPAVLSGEDSVEVGEEDSFLGQSTAHSTQPSTFSYFSKTTTSSDPFSSIGQQAFSSTAMAGGPSASSKGFAAPSPGHNTLPKTVPPAQADHVLPPAFPQSTGPEVLVGSSPPSSAMPPLPGSSQQAGFNPYRHTPQSSKANPYLAPPQLQQSQAQQQQQQLPFLPPSTSVPPSQSYLTPSVPPTQAPVMHNPQLSAPPAGPVISAPPMTPYNYNVYEPVQPHWFYCKQVEQKHIWLPFSFMDSAQLEEVFNSVQPDPENVTVCTDGGRYDVQLYDRLRHSVYWEEEPSEVRRCSWFYKGDTDSRFVPYTEEFSEKLESEYKKAVFTNQWHKRLEFPTGETIVMHNPKVIVQFQPSSVPDEWGTTQDGQTRPRVVKRGIDNEQDDVPDGEVAQVDHVVFMVHGIGPVCDLRFRSMVECVDDFRSVSLKLVQSHFKKAQEEKKINRIEFLPVLWYMALHGDATGVDRRIKKITLPSTSRLRHFTNETLLDILFYSSPTYCQTIIDTVSQEMNRMWALFKHRNPDFRGGVSVAGHSLGALILFDILSNQKDVCGRGGLLPSPPLINGEVRAVHPTADQVKAHPNKAVEDAAPVDEQVLEEANGKDVVEEPVSLASALEGLGLSEFLGTFEREQIDMESLLLCTMDDLKEMGIPLGPRKKLIQLVKDRVSAQQQQQKVAAEKRAEMEANKAKAEAATSRSQTEQEPRKSASMGGSISSRNVDYDHFEVGTGQVSVFYHSLDFEPINFFALGSPVAMFLTVRGVEKIDETYCLPSCQGFFNIYHPLDPVAYRMEPMIIPELDLKPVLIPHHKGRKRLHLELKDSLSRMGSDLKQGFISSLKSAWQTLNEFARAHTSSTQLQEELEKVANQIKEEEEKQDREDQKMIESIDSPKDEDMSAKIGMLNGGNRIDYVLQEKPIESFNEYLFALQSHLCYWESEDTALLILNQTYKRMGVVPEHNLH